LVRESGFDNGLSIERSVVEPKSLHGPGGTGGARAERAARGRQAQ
jgi:hypothetical protein